ncbi:cellulase family glycosylhydrolase [Polyangium mundeleinium]|uniref:Cellulase family glycosylhydrolase n=1 Tax=Polyangium mundeleinium TaxID=2995306 RepID=A0ABT5EYD3_9BACT|nr:cellulase family glycosylhydrolase [Polyangium mundeleinium]MDC0746841.1 cellulase family glycosylhydrolase [Polyangium mundeleinium]
MGRARATWGGAALLLVAGTLAVGPGCAEVEEVGTEEMAEAEMAEGETAEAPAAVISAPSRVGPYGVAKLADGTPAIVDGNGNRVVFHGVSRPGLESTWHGEGPSQPSLYIPVPDPQIPGGARLTPGIHPDEYAHMKQWGFDTVRLPVSWDYRCYGDRLADALSADPDADLPCNNPAVWEIYWQIIKDNVRKIQAQGMDVILDVRSDASVRGSNGVKENDWNHMPHVWTAEDGTAQNVFIGRNLQGQNLYGNAGVGNFLRRLGHELGHKPGQPNDGIDRSRVVFEIFDTPHVPCTNTADWSEDEIWRIWLDGTKNPDGSYGTKNCTLPKADGSGSVTKSFTYAGMRVLYERVREFGAQNVVLVPAIDGVDLRRVWQPQYQITGATNLAYAAKPYFWFAKDNGVAGVENLATFEALFDQYFGYLATQARLFPVVITEFASGEATSCTNDEEVDFLHSVLLYATRPNRQFGWAAWSWFFPDTPALRCGYYSSLLDGWRGPGGGAPGASLLGRGVLEFLKATQYIWPEVTVLNDFTCDPNVPGTLTWAMKHALPGQWVRFAVPRDTNGNTTMHTRCNLPPMKWGVRMVGNSPYAQGVCSGGRTTIDGTVASGHGLVLEGNNDLTNITVQHFPGTEIIELSPYQSSNKSWCVQVSP